VNQAWTLLTQKEWYIVFGSGLESKRHFRLTWGRVKANIDVICAKGVRMDIAVKCNSSSSRISGDELFRRVKGRLNPERNRCYGESTTLSCKVKLVEEIALHQSPSEFQLVPLK
jgi:hypothetical protein